MAATCFKYVVLVAMQGGLVDGCLHVCIYVVPAAVQGGLVD